MWRLSILFSDSYFCSALFKYVVQLIDCNKRSFTPNRYISVINMSKIIIKLEVVPLLRTLLIILSQNIENFTLITGRRRRRATDTYLLLCLFLVPQQSLFAEKSVLHLLQWSNSKQSQKFNVSPLQLDKKPFLNSFGNWNYEPSNLTIKIGILTKGTV